MLKSNRSKPTAQRSQPQLQKTDFLPSSWFCLLPFSYFLCFWPLPDIITIRLNSCKINFSTLALCTSPCYSCRVRYTDNYSRPTVILHPQRKFSMIKKEKSTPPPLCPFCNGSGQTSYFGGESRFMFTWEDCPDCCGTGVKIEDSSALRNSKIPHTKNDTER